MFTLFFYHSYTGLMRSGAVLEENRPIWYDVYKHFLPTEEPLAIRPEPTVTINPIYYPEDILRSFVFTIFLFLNDSYQFKLIFSTTDDLIELMAILHLFIILFQKIKAISKVII